jgi:hypothetical protein
MKMMLLYSKEHYDKYAAMSANAPTLTGAVVLGQVGCRDIEELTQLAVKDHLLNDIPLGRFDAYHWANTQRFGKGSKLWILDNICLMKHILLFQVLGVTPVFLSKPYTEMGVEYAGGGIWHFSTFYNKHLEERKVVLIEDNATAALLLKWAAQHSGWRMPDTFGLDQTQRESLECWLEVVTKVTKVASA